MSGAAESRPEAKARKPYTITKQRERWSDAEHGLFLEAIRLHGRAWRRIEEHIGTKTAVQIRSHAQKFFSKMERQQQQQQQQQRDDGEAEPDAPAVEIPPPRPKRKPSRPYPRKDGSGSFNTERGGNGSGNNSGDQQPMQQPSIVTGDASIQNYLNGGGTAAAAARSLLQDGDGSGGVAAAAAAAATGGTAAAARSAVALALGGAEVSEATIAAVAAAASAAAAAAAAAVVAAAGQQIQAHLQAHPPVGFPFFGLPPNLLAHISMQNPAFQAFSLADQATSSKVAPLVLAPAQQARAGSLYTASMQHPSMYQINTMEGAAHLLGALTEATATTGANHTDSRGHSLGSGSNGPTRGGGMAMDGDGDSACSRETDAHKNGASRADQADCNEVCCGHRDDGGGSGGAATTAGTDAVANNEAGRGSGGSGGAGGSGSGAPHDNNEESKEDKAITSSAQQQRTVGYAPGLWQGLSHADKGGQGVGTSGGGATHRPPRTSQEINKQNMLLQAEQNQGLTATSDGFGGLVRPKLRHPHPSRDLAPMRHERPKDQDHGSSPNSEELNGADRGHDGKGSAGAREAQGSYPTHLHSGNNNGSNGSSGNDANGSSGNDEGAEHHGKPAENGDSGNGRRGGGGGGEGTGRGGSSGDNQLGSTGRDGGGGNSSADLQLGSSGGDGHDGQGGSSGDNNNRSASGREGEQQQQQQQQGGGPGHRLHRQLSASQMQRTAAAGVVGLSGDGSSGQGVGHSLKGSNASTAQCDAANHNNNVQSSANHQGQHPHVGRSGSAFQPVYPGGGGGGGGSKRPPLPVSASDAAAAALLLHVANGRAPSPSELQDQKQLRQQVLQQLQILGGQQQGQQQLGGTGGGGGSIAAAAGAAGLLQAAPALALQAGQDAGTLQAVLAALNVQSMAPYLAQQNQQQQQQLGPNMAAAAALSHPYRQELMKQQQQQQQQQHLCGGGIQRHIGSAFRPTGSMASSPSSATATTSVLPLSSATVGGLAPLASGASGLPLSALSAVSTDPNVAAVAAAALGPQAAAVAAAAAVAEIQAAMFLRQQQEVLVAQQYRQQLLTQQQQQQQQQLAEAATALRRAAVPSQPPQQAAAGCGGLPIHPLELQPGLPLGLCSGVAAAPLVSVPALELQQALGGSTAAAAASMLVGMQAAASPVDTRNAAGECGTAAAAAGGLRHLAWAAEESAVVALSAMAADGRGSPERGVKRLSAGFAAPAPKRAHS